MFSDRGRWIKALVLWAAFIVMAVNFGHFESRRNTERIEGLFLKPIPEEGAPVALSFCFLRNTDPLMVHSVVGNIPVVQRDVGVAPGRTVSTRGRLLPNGTLDVEVLRDHPRRIQKTRVSLAALLLLTGLGMFRPRLWLRP